MNLYQHIALSNLIGWKLEVDTVKISFQKRGQKDFTEIPLLLVLPPSPPPSPPHPPPPPRHTHTRASLIQMQRHNNKYHQKNMPLYERWSKWIAYFYLETSNFKLAQKYSFHALEVLPVARNAKFQPMYSLLEGVTVRWFGHSNKVLMNGRSKCLSGLVFPPSKECFQFRKQNEITWGKVWGIRGVRQNSYFFFLQKRRNYCGGMSWGIVM